MHVVGALRRLGEPGDATLLAQRVENVKAAGKNLVGIGLMADVVDDLVFRAIELGMQREDDLDRTEA